MAKGTRRITSAERRRIAALLQDAQAAFFRRDFAACAACCDRIDAMVPGSADVHNLRGMMAADCGRLATAERHFRAALDAGDRRAARAVHANLAQLYLNHDMPLAAVREYRAAMAGRRWPEDAIAADFCRALCATSVPEYHREAVAIAERLLRRRTDQPEAAVALSLALQTTGRVEEAEALLRDLLDRIPGQPEATMRLAELYAETGRIPHAVALLEARHRMLPRDIATMIRLAQLKRFTDRADPLLQAMDARHRDCRPRTRNRMELAFALGRAMADLGAHEEAFDYWSEGNRLQRIARSYDVQSEIDHMEAIACAFSPDLPPVDSGLDAAPIFIVGMPRCGSTLTEQILAAHPRVAGKGESGVFSSVALPVLDRGDGTLTLEELARSPAEGWRRLGATYLREISVGLPEGVRVADKSLTNALYLGAIHRALPNARIVLVQRDPMDHCLSIFRHSFEGTAFGYGNDLEDLGRYYCAFQRLMDHWRRILPADRLYTLRYEALVEHQQEETRKLLDFCGLEWDDRCLQFHRARSQVKTASIAQVRRPIYRDSVSGWRRYARQLEPLRRIFEQEGLL